MVCRVVWIKSWNVGGEMRWRWLPVYWPPHTDPEIGTERAKTPHCHIAWNRIPLRQRVRALMQTKDPTVTLLDEFYFDKRVHPDWPVERLIETLVVDGLLDFDRPAPIVAPPRSPYFPPEALHLIKFEMELRKTNA